VSGEEEWNGAETGRFEAVSSCQLTLQATFVIAILANTMAPAIKAMKKADASGLLRSPRLLTALNSSPNG